jgi:hypothetical protein
MNVTLRLGRSFDGEIGHSDFCMNMHKFNGTAADTDTAKCNAKEILVRTNGFVGEEQ